MRRVSGVGVRSETREGLIKIQMAAGRSLSREIRTPSGLRGLLGAYAYEATDLGPLSDFLSSPRAQFPEAFARKRVAASVRHALQGKMPASADEMMQFEPIFMRSGANGFVDEPRRAYLKLHEQVTTLLDRYVEKP